MLDVISETLIDGGKLLPFLFITYLIMEYIEHTAGSKTETAVKKAGVWGPLAGGVLGMIPQCGFSAAASNLYAGRIISLGTLLAVYLSTSDEMLPILISERAPLSFLWQVLLLKMLLGTVMGFLIDFILRVLLKKERRPIDIHHLCEQEHCRCHEHGTEEEHSEHASIGRSILKPALFHTVRIFLFILLLVFLLNTLFYFIGEETLSGLISDKPIVSELIAGVIGLIPNCISSIMLTELYLKGLLSFGAMMSGLLVGAGVGLLILFRVNKNRKENLSILFLLYAIGVILGCIMELF